VRIGVKNTHTQALDPEKKATVRKANYTIIRTTQNYDAHCNDCMSRAQNQWRVSKMMRNGGGSFVIRRVPVIGGKSCPLGSVGVNR
jgi:hypothetical protein